MSKSKSRLSTGQTVVFRFSDKNLVGTVNAIKPIGKKYFYDVLCENGKVYENLPIDSKINETIDTYLTSIFYKKYQIEVDIPKTDIVTTKELMLDNDSEAVDEVTENEPVSLDDTLPGYDEENSFDY
jgi:hypothetical protein